MEIYYIRNGSEETQCESCGYPLYVDDRAIMASSGNVYCCRNCHDKCEQPEILEVF